MAGDEFGVLQDASTHRTSHLLAEKPSVAVSRPTDEAIKPPDTANKPIENPLPVEQVTLDPSSSMYFDPEVQANSWSPSPEFHSFLEKQFRRKLSFEQVCDILQEQAIPAVDALCAPTLDPSVINHIPSHNKKFVQERDKELSVIQRAMLNTTGPLCSLHDRLENNVAIDPVDLKRVVKQTLCLLGSANTQQSILRRKKVLANVNKTKIDLANQDLPNAKKWLKNSRHGSAKSPTKEGNFSDNTVGRWVLQPPFSNPEERRYNATSVRLKFIKQLYRKQTFSDVKFVIDQNATQSGRLDDQIRFAGRLPYRGNRSPVSKISPFYLERQNLSVPSSPLRAEYASKVGWGAVCDKVKTNGEWTAQDRALHINVLELKGAFLAVQALLKNQSHKTVSLNMDNSTAVAYINHKGGTHSMELTQLTLALCDWCIHRNIYLIAHYVPGKTNVLADMESRVFLDQTDWKLDHQVIQPFLSQYRTDLFATRLTRQLKQYISWRPDPEACNTDALTEFYHSLLLLICSYHSLY